MELSPCHCSQRATVSPWHGGLRAGDGAGWGCSEWLPPCSGYLQEPRAERAVLEQRYHFLPPQLYLHYGGMGGSSWLQESATQLLQKPAGPALGLELQWGDLSPHLPFHHSWRGWKQISTEEAPVRKSNKSQITLQAAPSHHRSCGGKDAAHSLPKLPALASPRVPALLASLSHSQHCPDHHPLPFILPAPAPKPKFCLFLPLWPSPGAVKGSPSPAHTRCCQGGSAGKAREDAELPPLTRSSLPSRPRALSRARGSARGHPCSATRMS